MFLKTFSVPAGNTISALMFATFRQVKIQLISLPEADRIQIVCCQIALGSKSNTFSGPTRSISCPWIVTANVFAPFVLIAPLRKYFLEQDFHGAFTIVVPDLKPRRFWWALHCSHSLSIVLYWEGRTRIPFCGTLLRTVNDGLYRTCGGTYGLSAVFAKFTSIFLGGASMEARPSLFCLPLPQ